MRREKRRKRRHSTLTVDFKGGKGSNAKALSIYCRRLHRRKTAVLRCRVMQQKRKPRLPIKKITTNAVTKDSVTEVTMADEDTP